MRALVTGHCGLVGSHIADALERRGYEITGVDVAQGTDVREFFRNSKQPFDLLVHAAAVVGGRATIEGAPLDVAVDLAIDAEAVQWALRTRPRKVVWFSSSAAYPVTLQQAKNHRLLSEDDIDLDNIEQPDHAYGWVKLTLEMQNRYLQDAGVDSLVVRPFSGYHPTRQSLDYPFPSFIRRALTREDPFVIWGTGHQTRDWIHIDDVTAATMTAIDEGVSGPVNLGTGRGTSFNQLAGLMAKASGYKPGLFHDVDKPSGVMHRVADNSRMLEFYKPQIELEDAIRKALA